MSVAQLRETFTDYIIADAFGEFAKENLEVETIFLSGSDSFSQLASGDVDLVGTAFSATAMNVVHSVPGVRAVAPLFYAPDPRTTDGLWVRNEFLSDPTSLRGKVIANTGPGSSTTNPISRYLQSIGLTVNDVEIKSFPAADIPTALETGAASAAWVVAPAAQKISDEKIAEFVQGYAPGDLAGEWFAGDLLTDNRDAVVAFVRALARTNALHLQPGYKSNPEIITALAEALDVPEDTIESAYGYIFTADLKRNLDTLPEYQQLWRQFPDLLSYDTDLTVDQVFDLTVIDDAVNP
ncbi:MAG: ABC transporter substrate-binding protein [Ilumatobacteraceae bacterium]